MRYIDCDLVKQDQHNKTFVCEMFGCDTHTHTHMFKYICIKMYNKMVKWHRLIGRSI